MGSSNEIFAPIVIGAIFGFVGQIAAIMMLGFVLVPAARKRAFCCDLWYSAKQNCILSFPRMPTRASFPIATRLDLSSPSHAGARAAGGCNETFAVRLRVRSLNLGARSGPEVFANSRFSNEA